MSVAGMCRPFAGPDGGSPKDSITSGAAASSALLICLAITALADFGVFGARQRSGDEIAFMACGRNRVDDANV
jgi:hypothetical protein